MSGQTVDAVTTRARHHDAMSCALIGCVERARRLAPAAAATKSMMSIAKLSCGAGPFPATCTCACCTFASRRGRIASTLTMGVLLLSPPCA